MTRVNEKLVFPSGLRVPCLGLQVMFCEDWVFFPDCVNISGLLSGLSWLTPSLYPFHGEMKKVGMRFTESGSLPASLILVPLSAIYLIPLGLIVHSIILNKVTIELPHSSVPVSHSALSICKAPRSGPNTEAVSTVSIILEQRVEGRLHSILSFWFPTSMFIYEYITSCYDCQLPYQSTARKDRGFINVYFGFYFPSLSFF